jgi:hypothetical protein
LRLFKLLSDTAARDKIAALMRSRQAGKAADIGSVIRRFESFVHSQEKRTPPIETDQRRLRSKKSARRGSIHHSGQNV